MTTDEIVTYLLACCDAEQGIKDCDSAISSLNEQRNMLAARPYQYYKLPEPFTETPPEVPKYKDIEKLRQLTLQSIANEEASLKKARATFDRWMVSFSKKSIADDKKYLADLDGELGRRFTAENELDRQRYEAELAKYNLDLADYNARTEAFRQTLKAADAETIKILDGETANYTEIREQYAERLEKLYGMGILHERFHNQEACAQLAEYLDMGIADELGGPNGAYRIYLDDLRTNKIVDAIGQVQMAVDRAADKICEAISRAVERLENNQRIMIWQIGNMRESFESMNSDIKTELDSINTTVYMSNRYFSQQFANTAAAQQEALREISDNQKKMQRTISASAFNQFLLQRRDNLDNYMFYALRNPDM